MTHIDTAQQASKITALCGRIQRNDDYLFCAEGDLREFQHLKEVTCPVCRCIVHKVQAGIVLSYAKLEAASVV